jgi:hypothetical protein
MFIHINPEELEPEFRNSWKMGHVIHPTIDYADNAIYAVFEGKQVIIFRFKDYGFINDNRRNTYEVSCGRAGILINIFKNKDYEKND